MKTELEAIRAQLAEMQHRARDERQTSGDGQRGRARAVALRIEAAVVHLDAAIRCAA